MPRNSGIGSRLRASRERLGWTREALAFHSGISWSAIAQLESGRRRHARPSTLEALSKALGVTIDYLVSGSARSEPMLEHRALLYAGDDEFLETVVPFLAEGIDRSEAVLAVTTKANITMLRDTLASDARRVDFVDAEAWYSAPGVALDGLKAFSSSSLEDGAPWIRFLGEPIWSGRSDSEVRQWTRYEALINLVFASSPMSILCPYAERSEGSEIVERARLTHPHTVGHDGMEASSTYMDPSSFVLDR